MRLFKGHNIKQISDKDKDSVPDHIKDQARQMAREELKRRLEELDMSAGEAKEYGGLLAEVEAHVNVLFELLESKWFLFLGFCGELDSFRLAELVELFCLTNCFFLYLPCVCMVFRPECTRRRTGVGETADGWGVG